MKAFSAYRYEVRVIAKRAVGENHLQQRLQKLLARKWEIDQILSTGFRQYTIVATRRVRVKR